MKSPEERGEFGVWLRDERTQRFKNVPLAVAAMKREAGYGISMSVWAELEAGTRRPSTEQHERLTRWFGSEPQTSSPTEASSDLVSAVRELTAAVRDSRAEQRANTAFLTQLLAMVAHTAGGEEALSQIAAAVGAQSPDGRK